MFSCDYCEILKNTYFEKHLRTAAFEIEWKCFLIHEIGLIILNLLCKTYFKCILPRDCTNTIVSRRTNRAQISGSANNLVWRFEKKRGSLWEKKTNSQSWPCELGKGRSLWEINCSLGSYKDVRNKLLSFSWHNCIVVA